MSEQVPDFMKEAYELGVREALAQYLEKEATKKGQKIKPGSLKGGKNEPSSKAKAGAGGRFQALKSKLGKKPGVKDPGALAAAIGRAKFGKGKFQHMAAKGK